MADVWGNSVAPGGFVCGTCGVPTESEPCAQHGAEIVGVTSARLSDGTVWPLPATEADELVWRLTYATPSQADLRRAARIIGAYGYLLTETNRERRGQVCRDMRAALSTRVTSPESREASDA